LRIEYNLLKRAGTGIPMFDSTQDNYEYLKPDNLDIAKEVACFDKPLVIHIG